MSISYTTKSLQQNQIKSVQNYYIINTNIKIEYNYQITMSIAAHVPCKSIFLNINFINLTKILLSSIKISIIPPESTPKLQHTIKANSIFKLSPTLEFQLWTILSKNITFYPLIHQLMELLKFKFLFRISMQIPKIVNNPIIALAGLSIMFKMILSCMIILKLIPLPTSIQTT